MAKKADHDVIFVRAAPDIAKALKELAEEEDRSKSNMVEVILRRYLEEVGKLPKENRLPAMNNGQAA